MFDFSESRQLFGSPGGKSRLASLIVSYFPDHDLYVEAFAGGAAVFFAKKESKAEVLNDADPEIMNAYRAFQDNDLAAIEKAIEAFDWNLKSREQWEKIRDKKKEGLVGALEFLFSLRSSFAWNRRDFAPYLIGTSRKPRIKAASLERLQAAKLVNKSWEKIVEEYDSPRTLFYFDPPYSSKWTGKTNPNPDGSKREGFDFWKFASSIKGIKGKWILSCQKDVTTEAFFKKFEKRDVVQRNSFKTYDPGMKKQRVELLVANFPLKTNEAFVEAIDFKIDQYDPTKVNDKQLADDWKLLVAKYAALQKGEETEFDSIPDLLDFADDVFNEIRRRGKIKLDFDGAEVYKQFLRAMLRRNVNEGPVLPAIDAELIFKGEKKAITKGERVPYLEALGLLSSARIAWGWLRAKAPVEVDVEEFDKRFEEHKVTARAREIRFPGARKLFLYEIDGFLPLLKPEKVKGIEKDEPFARDVRFAKESLVPESADLEQLSDLDLVTLHGSIHEEAFEFMSSNPPDKGFPETMVDRHFLVVKEYERREIEHPVFSALDLATNKFEKKSAVAKERIEVAECLKLWGREFTIRSPLLSIVDGAIDSGFAETLQVQVNAPEHDREFYDTLAGKLVESLPGIMKDRIEFVVDQGREVRSRYLPIADLVVRFRRPEDRKIVNESTQSIKERRQAIARTRHQGEQTRRADKIEVGRYFVPIKRRKLHAKESASEWANEIKAE